MVRLIDGGTASDILPITPNDSTDLAIPALAIRCTGSAGTLRITTRNGNVRNTSIEAGDLLLAGATRVHATGTTATGLEAFV